ncbi:MAG: imelysin family protein [Amphritea sp.]|nr:imelysin family protein [Amphritea sp.]
MKKHLSFRLSGILISSALFSSALVSSALLSTSVAAAPAEQDWQALNNTLVQQHILPRYQQLQSSSETLAAQSASLCQSFSPAQLEITREAYHQTMSAWQALQHIQFGPIQNLMRNFSMQFWPDKKNLIGKQVAVLLKEQKPETLDTEYMFQASIGVKGLPAMERLLFADQAENTLANNSYACRLNSTIATYIELNAQGTVSEWQDFATEISNAGDGESYYESHQEAAVDMMKAMVEPIEVIRDLKLLRPLGKGDKLRPKRLESWRSLRSLENLQINISTLHDIYSGGENRVKAMLENQGDTALAEELDTLFKDADRQLAEIPGPLYTTLTEGQTAAQLIQLSDTLKVLHIGLLTAMQKLDVQLGFNSRDGD